MQFMKMMTHLTIKDYVDFEDNGTQRTCDDVFGV